MDPLKPCLSFNLVLTLWIRSFAVPQRCSASRSDIRKRLARSGARGSRSFCLTSCTYSIRLRLVLSKQNRSPLKSESNYKLVQNNICASRPRVTLIHLKWTAVDRTPPSWPRRGAPSEKFICSVAVSVCPRCGSPPLVHLLALVSSIAWMQTRAIRDDDPSARRELSRHLRGKL